MDAHLAMRVTRRRHHGAKRSRALLVPVLAGMLAASPAVAAEQYCLTRDVIVERLGAEYAEQAIALGLAGNGTIVEVFSTDSGSTWTIVVSSPGGRSCVVAAGETWISTDKLALDPES